MALNRQLAPASPGGQVFDDARRAFSEIGQTIGPIRHFVEQAIADHPIQAVGLSLAMGVLLGWLIKR